jgi:hypothetical protein
MNYNEMKKMLEAQSATGKLNLDLKSIDSKLVDDLDDFFLIDDGKLNIPATIRIEPDKPIEVIFNFKPRRFFSPSFYGRITLFNNNNNIDYVITVEPEGKWEKYVGNDVTKFVNSVGIELDNILFYFTSVKESIEIRMDGGDNVFSLAPAGRYNIVANVPNILLNKFGLADCYFQISKENFTLSKDVRLNLSVLGIIEFIASKITITGRSSLIINGGFNIDLFPTVRVTVPSANLEFTDQTYSISAQIKEDNIKIPLFKGLTFYNISVTASGEYYNQTYSMGAKGHFFASSKKEQNSFEIVYTNVSSGPIPALFKGFIKKISFSDSIQMLTGESMSELKKLDSIMSFFDTNIYWCDQPNIPLDGGIAEIGFGVSSGFLFLGIKGHASLSAFKDAGEVSGDLALEPINMANGIVMINGGSDKEGVKIDFKTDGIATQFSGSVNVSLFKEIHSKALVQIKNNKLCFRIRYDLPFKSGTYFSCTLEDKYFEAKSALTFKTPEVKVDVGIAKLSSRFSISAVVSLIVKDNSPKFYADVTPFKVLGQPIDIPRITLDYQDLQKLDRKIVQLIASGLKSALDTALLWLRAIVEGIIEVVGTVLEIAKQIANELNRLSIKTAEAAAKLMKEAGMACSKACEVLKNGFNKKLKDVVELLHKAEYSAKKIARVLEKEFNQTVNEIYDLLRAAGVPSIDIGKALQHAADELIDHLKDLPKDVKHVAEILNGLGKNSKEALNILHKTFGVSKLDLKVVLSDAGFKEVSKAFSSVFNTPIGGGGKNSFWRKPFG